jgi:LacI family transcriptional regulator
MASTTMKRIASELGVSITTISKVLNHHDDISPATRARVMAKVEELGYRPNAVARSLTLRRTHTLGVVIPDLLHSFFVEIIAGIEPVASERGYGLLLCSSGENPAKERSELQLLHGRQVDGIVLASTHGSGNTEILRELHAHGTGLVMIDRDDYPNIPCHRVITDDERVGVLATEHLLASGRRAIAHLSGPRLTHARRREKGWKAALRAAGIPIPHEWIIPGGFMEIDGYRAMKRALSLRPNIDAVFAVNDPSAIGAMKAIWEAGLKVPDDIAVVGAGDVIHGELLKVPLTTVSWSRAELGREAAELLLNAAERNGGEPRCLCDYRQIPGSKLQIPMHSQPPTSKLRAHRELLGIWDLGVPWDSGLGAWDLTQRSTLRQYSTHFFSSAIRSEPSGTGYSNSMVA